MRKERAKEDDLGWNIGRYTLYGEIASGGMATVHIGRMVGEIGFAKLVAIKRLHSHLAGDEEFLDMFLDEVRLAGRIRHPNVVQPLDVVVTGGEVFLVMEYIHGEALSRLLRAARQSTLHVPMRITSAIITNVLNGLHAAHEARDERGQALGIVHRDVSPQNVIVGVDGVARVLDFGIAKAADQLHSTKVGELKGKLAYMAPEQIKGKEATRRTDVYATGIVLWECLTGHRLFDGDAASVGALMKAQAEVEPPSRVNPQISAELDALVMRALSINPELRFASALEMAEALDAIVPHAPQSQVGQWVEQVAKAALTERSARIAEIESAGADSSARATAATVLSGKLPQVEELTGSAILEDDSAIVRAKPTPPPPPPARASIPSASFQRKSVTPPPAPPSSSSEKKFVVPAPRPNLPLTPTPPMDFEPERNTPVAPLAPFSPRAELTSDFSPRAELTSELSGPLSAPSVPTEYSKPAKVTVMKLPGRKRSLLPYLWILLGVALIALILAGPELIRRRVVEHAAKDGLELSVDSVDLSLRTFHVTLKNVTMKSKEIPGVNLHAEVADADLSGLELSAIAFRNVDLVIDGRYGEVTDSFTKWAAQHEPLALLEGAQKVRFESLHVSWNGVLGAGTKTDGSGIVLELARTAGRPLGQDGSGTFPALKLETPLGALGPWRFEVAREASATRVKVLLDAGAPNGPSLDANVNADGAVTIDSRMTRALLHQLGVPLLLLGQKADDATKIDLSLHVELKADTLSGNTRVHLYDARFGGSTPMEAELAARFSGPRTAVVPFQESTLTIGEAISPLGGSISYDSTGLRVEALAKVKGCAEGASFLAIVDTREPQKSGGGLVTKGPCRGK